MSTAGGETAEAAQPTTTLDADLDLAGQLADGLAAHVIGRMGVERAILLACVDGKHFVVMVNPLEPPPAEVSWAAEGGENP